MSRDMGLIGLLRYLPLVQFTKARPVDSLGPFSLASLETGFVMATRLPATRGCSAHTNKQTDRCTRVPARLFESPRHSGATNEGLTPRLLRMGLPGVPEDGRPTKMSPGPGLGPLCGTDVGVHDQYGRHNLAYKARLGLGNHLCNLGRTPRDLA